MTNNENINNASKKRDLLEDIQKNIGKKPSDIKRDRQVEQETDRLKNDIPKAPPLPNQGETSQKKGWNWKFWRKEEKKKVELNKKEQIKEDLNRDIKNLGREDLETNFLTLYGVMEQLQQEKENWEINTATFKESIEKLTNVNDELTEENKELRLKLSIEPLRPQPKNIPTMNERDRAIIQQATAHLETITNATTLRNKILEAEQKNTKEAFWDLHAELKGAGELQQKLIKYFQQDLDQATSYVWTLGAILRGEYLNEK